MWGIVERDINQPPPNIGLPENRHYPSNVQDQYRPCDAGTHAVPFLH